jgi:hypothetical protein
MANAIDILVDEYGDLKENAITLDWEEGNSDGQHVQDILELEAGELKYEPLIGVGIIKSINGPVTTELRKLIEMQLENDGYDLEQLQEFINAKIELNVVSNG